MALNKEKIITATLTAIITTVITVGVPSALRLLKPDDTINVILQDLRAENPQKFDEYISSELQGTSKIIMDKPQSELLLNNQVITHYLLNNEKFVSLDELIKYSNHLIKEESDGSIAIIPEAKETHLDNTSQQASTSSQNQDWLSQCVPYEVGNYDVISATQGKSFKISGESYANGLICNNTYSSAVLFNINSKYSSLTVSIGHIDDSAMADRTFNFYVDNELVQTVNVSADRLKTEIQIPLNYGKQLKIEDEGTYPYPMYGFVNGTFIE